MAGTEWLEKLSQGCEEHCLPLPCGYKWGCTLGPTVVPRVESGADEAGAFRTVWRAGRTVKVGQSGASPVRIRCSPSKFSKPGALIIYYPYSANLAGRDCHYDHLNKNRSVQGDGVAGRVSLSFMHDRTLFKPFSESFKNFKTRYFKVMIWESGRSEFFDEANVLMFPFYLTQNPRRISAFAISRMNPKEHDVVRVINDLSRRLKAHSFIDCLKYEDFDQIAFGYTSLPPPRKTSWTTSSHRQKGPDGSKGVEGPSGTSSRAASNTGVAANIQGQVTVAVPTPEINIPDATTTAGPDPIQVFVLEQSSDTPTESTAPLERKRKSREADNCRESRPSPALPAGIFDPSFDAVAHSSLRVGPSQRAVIEGMSRDEMLSAALELTIHGAMMTLSVREFDIRQSGPDVDRQLYEEKKAGDALRAKLEALALDHQGCAERQKQLQADLDEARHQLVTAKEGLKTSHARGETLAEDANKLKMEVRSERLSANLLAANTENSRLTAELVKANESITLLDTNQTTFLLKVDPLSVGFDIVDSLESVPNRFK
ncbi:hypothetical protein V8G54_001452 [Vigna mungo]|uniref:Uncharacterized protein n=1 Tax=Vigna mungo TaxID=3915 RepID=A0AAQ3SAZ4_VIGMU